jgi:DMSO reductase anchor subunit
LEEGRGLVNFRDSTERGNMGNILLDFITLGSLAVVVWAVIDVARRPAVALDRKWKAVWIAGMVGAWFVFGAIGAFIATFYLAGPRRRLNAVSYSGRH